MNSKIVSKVTASFPARCASLGNVTIQEITEFVHITGLDGRPQTIEGIKAYSINSKEPVNRDDSGYTLARTGERLELL